MAELYYNAKVYVEKGHYEQAVLVEDGIIRRIGSSWPMPRLTPPGWIAAAAP